jgi:hypothetical protein
MPDAGRRSPLARKVDALTFKVGTILLLAAGVGVSADAYTERANAFWTSDLMVASGGLLLVSMGCLTKALWASSFDRRSQGCPQSHRAKRGNLSGTSRALHQ